VQSILACPQTLIDLALEPGWNNNYEEFYERKHALEELRNLISSDRVTLYILPTFLPIIYLYLSKVSTENFASRAISELLALGKADLKLDYEQSIEVANSLLRKQIYRETQSAPKLHEMMLLPCASALKVDALTVGSLGLSEKLTSLCNEEEEFADFDVPIFSIQETIEFLSNNQQFRFHSGDDIYVRTPRGTVKKLRGGATVIDFAYAIHTDIGNNCVGAFVNGEESPLNRILETNNVVEIIQEGRPHPDPGWLEFVRTRTAKKSIKRALRCFWKDRGWEIVRQEFNIRAIGRQLEAIAVAKNCTLNNLVEQVGEGKISIDELSRQLQKTAMHQLGDAIQIMATEGNTNGSSLYHLPNLQLSKCCLPFPGDDSVGIFGINDNVVRVHQKNCHSIRDVEPEKLQQVVWYCERCYIELSLLMRDHPDTLRQVLNELAERKLTPDIRNVFTSRDGKARATVTLPLESRGQMEQIVSFIEAKPNVHQVKIKRSYPCYPSQSPLEER
jgi:hypothetical protein